MIKSTAPKIQRLKILSIGDANVGKSCVIKRYCESRFVPEYIATIGIDYGVKPLKLNQKDHVHVDFWDTAGDEIYLEIRNEFYGSYDGLLLVFDVANARSFENLENWLAELDRYSHQGGDLMGKMKSNNAERKGIVLGNKIDVLDEKRQVPREIAEKWAKQMGFVYFETSAYSGQGINEAFEHLFELSYHPIS